MGRSTGHRFKLEGKFITFTYHRDGLPKGLYLEAEGEPRWCKLAKPLRSAWAGRLHPGDRILVSGKEQRNAKGPLPEEQQAKRKVVALCALGVRDRLDTTLEGAAPCESACGCVRICTKANCWKNGGMTLWQAFEQEVREKGLQQSVHLEPVRCLDNCKHCPNIQCTTEAGRRTHYSRLRPRDVPAILDRHFLPPDPAGVRDRVSLRAVGH